MEPSGINHLEMVLGDPRIFFGNHDLTIDSKNRMTIPASIRRAIKPDLDGKGFFITVGENGLPWLYTQRVYIELAKKQTSDRQHGADALKRDAKWYGLAEYLEFDPQNRVLIPEKIIRKTGVGKSVTLVGYCDHLQLWSQQAWAAYEDDLYKPTDIELSGTTSGISAGVSQPVLSGEQIPRS